ncbi:MAG: glycosyltransferase family 1 protein [Nitrospirae bacterium]|nr:glycosyltransferase family 1 protein [Nitrospirota bacterium]
MPKRTLLWTMWPDELSAELGHYFDVVYLQDVPRMAAVGPNFRVDQRLRAIQKGRDHPIEMLFLNAWTRTDSLLGMELLPVPAVVYLHDTNYDLDSCDWDLAQGFAWVLVENAISVEYHVGRRAPYAVTWCPLYFKWPAREALRCRPGNPRRLDVAFVGNLSVELHPGRADFLRAVERRIAGRWKVSFGPGKVLETYADAKIVLNESWSPKGGASAAPYGINFRVFEAMGCGALLLTDSPTGDMSTLFHEGVHYVGFERGNVDQVVDLVGHYLDREVERLSIAQAGWEEVVRSHTVEARAQVLAPLLTTIAENGRGLATADPTRAAFHLGRYILRSLLVWRLQSPCARHPQYVERLAEAERLLGSVLSSPDWGPAARALLPVIRFVMGDPQGAVTDWLGLLDQASTAAFSAPFLTALSARPDSPFRGGILPRLQEVTLAPLPSEEDKVMAEMAFRACYARGPQPS